MRSSADRGNSLQPASSEDTEAPRLKTRRRRRARLLWLLALLAAVSLSLLLLFGAVRSVRDDLLLARSSMERGRDQLLAGHAAAAAASFEEARGLFSEAEGRTKGPVLRAVAWLPVIGRTPDAVLAIAESGTTTAEAATVLARAVSAVPGGPAGLAPTNGAVPVDRIPPLAEAAREADALMQSAVARLEEAPDTLLIGPVAPALREAEGALGDLGDTIHAASSLLEGLPAFLGAAEPSRYFFGAQNPAELRGTGGLIGTYSILTIDDGRFRFSPFVPIHGLPAPSLGEVPPPNDDYAANYDQFRRGGRFWTSINVMPDFPSVAEAILNAYEEAAVEQLDGVILVDPFALEALLQATGPVELPGYDLTIDAGNVVSFTTNEAYSVLTDPTGRKRILGDVARAAFARFIARPSSDLADLKLLLEAAAGRHILVYSKDPLMQEGLRATAAGGALVPPGSVGGFLSVVVNSAAGSKVDFYQEREVRHSVVLGEDGAAAATTELVLRNLAPTSGQPPYVIGPFKPVKRPGESVVLVNVYCGTDCVPGVPRMNGTPTEMGLRADLGVRYLQTYFSLPSGKEASLELSWEDPNAWVGNGSGGTYRMTFANQVTIRPTVVSIRIEPPPGMDIVGASSSLRVVDGAAVYEGTPGSRLDLEVEFRPPLPVRLWRNVSRFLSTPLF